MLGHHGRYLPPLGILEILRLHPFENEIDGRKPGSPELALMVQNDVVVVVPDGQVAIHLG